MRFELNNTYTTRSIGDADCIIELPVLGRTAKTIQTLVFGERKTLRVFEIDGVECVRPWGSYSMAPIVRAA